jgi:hypothetical protein
MAFNTRERLARITPQSDPHNVKGPLQKIERLSRKEKLERKSESAIWRDLAVAGVIVLGILAMRG